jgi:hypothetical protein
MLLSAITIRLPLPGWLVRRLRDGRLRSHASSGVAASSLDLVGDRDVEWSWVVSHIPEGPGEALDFGPGGSHLGLVAAHRGFRVTALDLQPVNWSYLHPGLRFVQGDLLTLPFPKHCFDLVINCSTVEHVGLAGRYGVSEQRPDGDLDAMAYLRTTMKPAARMLLTVPVGRDAVVGALHRVYGPKRLERLLEGYSIESQEYWAKSAGNIWVPTDRGHAMTLDAGEHIYGLGCLVLRA